MMSETLWTVIIGAVAGLISGGIASLIAPWVNWGIEKQKQKLTFRRDLIAKWRAMIHKMVFLYEHSAQESEGLNFSELLARQPDYLSLRQHLSREEQEHLYKLNIPANTTIVIEGSDRVNQIDQFASYLTSKVAELENAWNLV